jgi:HEAT repeat protein
MNILCPNCWHELSDSLAVCPGCDATVDLYSRDYEHRLIAALPDCETGRRADICLILGLRARRTAVPALLESLRDPEIVVRMAALRSLSEIGDRSAIPGIEELTSSKQEMLRTAANRVLKALTGKREEPHQRSAS